MNVIRIATLDVTLGAGFAFAENTGDAFRVHFDKGKVFYAAGKFEEAAAEFESVPGVEKQLVTVGEVQVQPAQVVIKVILFAIGH